MSYKTSDLLLSSVKWLCLHQYLLLSLVVVFTLAPLLVDWWKTCLRIETQSH